MQPHKEAAGVAAICSPPIRGERGDSDVLPPNKRGESYEERNVETSIKNFCTVYCIVDVCR